MIRVAAVGDVHVGVDTHREGLRTRLAQVNDDADVLLVAGDLTKLCGVSGVAATIEAAKVPLSGAARSAVAADAALIETILTGGDDYEILCTVPSAKVESFTAAATAAKVPLTDIGTVSPGEGARFLDADQKPLTFSRLSYSHF